MKTFRTSTPSKRLGASVSTRNRLSAALLGGLSLVSTLFAVPALAQQTTPISVQQVNASSLRVRVANPAQQLSQVQVFSLVSGQKLFDQTYADGLYSHRLDFRNLRAGRYALVMKVGQELHRYSLQVRADNAPSVAVRAVKIRLPKPNPNAQQATAAGKTVEPADGAVSPRG